MGQMQAQFHHVAIQTNDLARAERFYCEVLGMKVIRRETSPKGRRIVWLKTSGGRIELYNGKPGQKLAPAWTPDGVGPVSVGLRVVSLEPALEHARAHGARILREPYEPVPGERAAFLEGPDGEEIVLVERPVDHP